MNYQKELENLVKEGSITMEEGFALSSEMARFSSNRQEEMLQELKEGSRSAQSLLEELRRKPGSDFSSQSEEVFQDFKEKIKVFGREVGSEVENIISEFDKDKFKSNLKDLFNDLSDTFKDKNENGRVMREDYKEGDLTVLDKLHVQGQAEFSNLVVKGSLSVEQNLTADRIQGTGQIRIQGDLNCKNLDFEGELFVEGNLQTGTTLNRGRLVCRGDYSSVDLENRGTVNVQGDIQLVRLDNQGNLAADRAIRADRVKSEGVLNCLGLMQAGIIDLEEGRVSYMEGDQITLGRNCRVEDLVYRISLQKHESTRIGREKHLS